MATNPQQFIISSDFASLKEDDGTTLTITLPGSVSVPAGDSYSLSTDATVGTKNASQRVQIESSKLPGDHFASGQVYILRQGTVGGTPDAFYDVYAYITRPTATTLRANVKVLNPYEATLTGASGSETFTFDVKTFLSPFEK